MSEDSQSRIRARRAAIDALPPAGRPAALADLADMVEEEAGLPGVARALRQQALDAARSFAQSSAAPPQDALVAALIAALEARLRKVRTSPRPCPRDRPVKPDTAAWKERMATLARKNRGR